ncbi:MAG TPA: HAMP domain-containing sensor histidine kinase [Rubrobacteraceae bacterium]|nr:HAMP domain-containing sensor histidine kinase [Rubrobacteraceae bacterium]
MIERIRRRLTLGYVGILALILLLFGAIVVGIFSAQLNRQQDEQLTRQAQDVAGFVRNHGPGGAEADEPTPDRSAPSAPKTPGLAQDGPRLRHDDGSGIAVYVVPPKTLPDGADAGEEGIYGKVSNPGVPNTDLGLPFTGAAREAEREASRNGARGDGPGGGAAGGPGDGSDAETLPGPDGGVRVVSVPVIGESGQTIAVVQAAQSRRAVDETVEDLLLALVPVGVASLLLAGVGGLFMSRRAMQPVKDSFQRQRTFIADASHELKTPLALVKVGAEVMRRNPADPENREVIEDQLSEIDRMNALLSDLLVLARLDAGRLDVEDKPFDLSVIAAETAGRFLTRAANESVRMEVEVPDRLPARGDSDRTAQILTALLDNAMRYTPEGGTITVSGRRLGDGVEASVSDTGPGVPAEHLDRIFDRFYRAEEARTRAGGGTGLGLSIARDLARAQRGDLSAQNVAEGGTGAIFRLKLPAQ